MNTLLAVIFGIIGFIAVIVAVVVFYGACGAFLWNDWGVDFSSWFHSEDLTFKQAGAVGMLIFALRFRLPTPAKESE